MPFRQPCLRQINLKTGILRLRSKTYCVRPAIPLVGLTALTRLISIDPLLRMLNRLNLHEETRRHDQPPVECQSFHHREGDQEVEDA